VHCTPVLTACPTQVRTTEERPAARRAFDWKLEKLVVAWNEPRVRATGLILVAAIQLLVVTHVVGHPDSTAAVSLVMGLVPWLVVRQADVIRHPVDPIGGSESTAIQVFYVLMVLTVAGLAATLIAWLWLGAEQKHRI
jgi:hypothetical protein